MARVISDLHIHSKYSRATSEKMNIEEITRFARVKGLNLVGTGDFTHPKWLKELSEDLVEAPNTSLYKPAKDPESPVHYMVTSEVSTIFNFGGEIKKVHHVILTPSLETAVQVNERLARFGNLTVDGRPTLDMTAPQLVEEVMEVSKENVVIPSHAWTPWFSIFGAFSGFDRVEDCYQDMTKHIPALETGLSCYDEETEVLSNNGWKRFPEIKFSDKICTLNLKTDRMEFENPIRLFKYGYKGKMYRLKTKRVDLLVTPNHKLLFSPCDFRKPSSFSLKEAEFLFNKSKRLKKDGIWIGREVEYFILPTVKVRHGNQYYSGFRNIKERKLPIKAWLKFFGLWVAEGWTSEGKKGDYNVCLTSKNSDLLSEMKSILESFGYTVHKLGNVIRIRNYQLFCYLRQFGKSYEKFIPSNMKSVSKDLLEIILEYYLKGNGHKYGREGKGLSATTSSVRLRDDLQEIALKIGISAYYKQGRKRGSPITSSHPRFRGYKHKHDSWQIYFLRQNRPIISPSMMKRYNHIESWIDFDGFVFCVEVPNHVIYIRRNGIPLWCGNSDPPMNWRLSALDKFALVSNSDSHSSWPWRIGREANVFELSRLTYREVTDAIREKDSKRFKFTIETDPAYGKYHWTGHRNCNVSLSPQEAVKLGNRCPVCRRRLTKGVEQRVEELADRPVGFKPEGAIGYMHLLPLSEIIAAVLQVTYPGAPKVWSTYNALVQRFNDEYTVLIDAPIEGISKIVDPMIAEAIVRVREEKVRVTPGYDGVYGQLVIFEGKGEEKPSEKVMQRNITDFM